MSLENTFYIVGIIAMSLYTLLLIAIVILLFYIKNKISEVYEKVESRLDAAKSVFTHPAQTAVMLGASAAGRILGWAVNILRRR